MTLNLTSTPGSSFIKDYPAQNAVNCNAIDSYMGPCLTTQPLQSYTAQLTGSSIDPTLGAGGYSIGYYYRFMDWVYAWGEFRFGTSGTAPGTGIFAVNLPLIADISLVSSNGTPARGSIVGDGFLWDDSSDAGKRPLSVQLFTPTSVCFLRTLGDTSSEFIYSGSPITWTINDGLTWSARYRRIP